MLAVTVIHVPGEEGFVGAAGKHLNRPTDRSIDCWLLLLLGGVFYFFCFSLRGGLVKKWL